MNFSIPWTTRLWDAITFVLLFVIVQQIYPCLYQGKKKYMLTATLYIAGNFMILMWEFIPGWAGLIAYILNFALFGWLLSLFSPFGTTIEKAALCTFAASSIFHLYQIEICLWDLFKSVLPNGPSGRHGLAQLLLLGVCIWLSVRKKPRMMKNISPVAHSMVIIISTSFSILYSLIVFNLCKDRVEVSLLVECMTLGMTIIIMVLCEKLNNDYQQRINLQSVLERQRADIDALHSGEQISHHIHVMRHEMLNHMQLIQTMCKQGNMQALCNYVDAIAPSYLSIASPVDTGNEIITAVLQQKIAQAIAENIPMDVEANAPKKIDISDSELCSLLSNLLNNALEASHCVKNPEIKVKIRKVKNYLHICIQNHVATDVLSDNPELKSSKADEGHGIGLEVVRQICEKTDSMMDLKMNDGFFQAEVLLKLCED